MNARPVAEIHFALTLLDAGLGDTVPENGRGASRQDARPFVSNRLSKIVAGHLACHDNNVEVTGMWTE